MKSSLTGFYKLSREEKISLLESVADVTPEEKELLMKAFRGPLERYAEAWTENVVSVYGLPYSIATNFIVNSRELLVPMVVEESSVVAAASFGAKLVRNQGGFQAEMVSDLMIGQIYFPKVESYDLLMRSIHAHKQTLIDLGNKVVPRLVMRGGGVRDLRMRIVDNKDVVVHVLIDTRDAMGANIVSSVCETLAPVLEELTGNRTGMKILSNLSDQRRVRTKCLVAVNDLSAPEISGHEVARRIVEATEFANADPYRAATHNKGVMNGIDPVVISTGNDWRAVEAGAHAFAVRDGSYKSLTSWTLSDCGHFLKGELEVPMALGVVGGVTSQHPLAALSLKLMGVATASELAQVVTSVGLAQNLSAIRALVSEGIQHGHMRMHAKNIAVSAGAEPHEVEFVAEQMGKRFDGRTLGLSGASIRAQEILTELRSRHDQ